MFRSDSTQASQTLSSATAAPGSSTAATAIAAAAAPTSFLMFVPREVDLVLAVATMPAARDERASVARGAPGLGRPGAPVLMLIYEADVTR
ncbi:hypothetical protein GCM10010178_60120 [Lentzea flava]|uniref:Uncharacterized protein n=1 Tax=Lentzea flava TaxID=103732 RepID=A0ABQ2UZJ6_9PSEU|nr:hypothetical protein GCM10010178_60120 [Lentzea flava]